MRKRPLIYAKLAYKMRKCLFPLSRPSLLIALVKKGGYFQLSQLHNCSDALEQVRADLLAASRELQMGAVGGAIPDVGGLTAAEVEASVFEMLQTKNAINALWCAGIVR